MGDVAALGILRPEPRPGVLWTPIRARRCLFGAPDPETTERFLEKETKKLEKRNQDRWNFDFIQGTPLKGGRYAWTAVTKDDAAAVTAAEEKDGASSSPSEKDRDDEGSTCATSTDGKLSQTLITDFMRKRKLSSNQKEVTLEPKVKTRRRFST